MPSGKNENKINKNQSKENRAIESAKDTVTLNKQRKVRILDCFGPNSQLHEYNKSVYKQEDKDQYKSIKLPRPAGLTDEMIAMIALGDSLDPRRLNKPLTSSSAGGNQDTVTFNQTFILENILPGDPRTENFGKVLCESKANTKNILEEYQKGNAKPAQEAIKRAITTLTSSLGTTRTDSSTSNPTKETFRIINEMRKVPNLNVDSMLTDKEKAKLTALEHKMKAADKAAESAAELMEKMPPANSPEREKLVLDYLFNTAIASEGFSGATDPELSRQANKEVYDMFEEYKDFDPRSEGTGESFYSSCVTYDSFSPNHPVSPKAEKLGMELTFAGDRLKCVTLDETIFPSEGYLAADNNTERLRKLTEDEIKKSDYYKQLMNAQSVLEMEAKLKAVPKNGFAVYPGVNIPDDESKKFNDNALSEKYTAKKKEIEDNIREYVKDVYPQQYAEKFGVEIEKPVPSNEDLDILDTSNRQYARYQKADNAIVNMFGTEGKLRNTSDTDFEQKDINAYNAITLNKPKGLSEETIALIAIGAAMNPARLNKGLVSSSMPNTDQTEFNKDYILTNVLTEKGKSKNFGSVLVDSRKETAEILKAYEEGNLEPAKEALKRVAEKNIEFIGSKNMRNSCQSAESNLHRMLQNVKKENPELGLDQLYTKAQDTKEKINAVQNEYSKKAIEAKNKLFNELPPPNSPERRKLVLDYLFCKEIASAGYEETDESSEKALRDVYNLSEKYSAMFPDQDKTGSSFYEDNIKCEEGNEVKNAETLALKGKIETGAVKLELLLRQNKFTAVEGVIAADGIENLKQRSKYSIEHSVEYMKLVNAKDITALEKVMSVKTSGNFQKKFLHTVSNADADKLRFKNDLYDKQLEEIATNIDEYAKKTNPEKYAHAFDPKTIVDDAVVLMGSDRLLHIDSNEIKKARADAKLLQKAMSSSKCENVMEDPNVKAALFEAYKSGIKYKNVKKKDAKIDLDDHDWTPRTQMGKDRYKGISAIEDLARKYITDEIVKLANEELKAEEAANGKKQYEQFANTELDPNELGASHMNKAQERLRKKAEGKSGRRPSLADIPEGASEYSDELAHIIAANLLGRSYDQIPGGTDLVDDYEVQYEKLVEETKNDIKDRDDFKMMVKSLDPDKAVRLGLTKDGKGLIMKLSEASRSLQKNNQTDPDNPNLITDLAENTQNTKKETSQQKNINLG